MEPVDESIENGERHARHRRMVRITALAERVWEDQTLAREFLTSPQPGSDGVVPIELAATPDGFARVEAMLMKIEHSLPV
jgi:uncharacterized protein (DUF2384 family)